MSPEDRDLLFSLRRQQADLQQALERLNSQLTQLETRAGVVPEVALPPIPVEMERPLLPPLPADAIGLPPLPDLSTLGLPPIPGAAPQFPPLPLPPMAAPRRSFESHVGYYLTRFAVLFILLGVVALGGVISTHYHLADTMPAAGKLALGAIASMLLVILGQRLDARRPRRPILSLALMACGLGGIFKLIVFGGFVESLKIFPGPLFAGCVLFLWTLYILFLADRRGSEFLAVFALVLGYIGTLLNPNIWFALSADLILAVPAAAFLMRYGWAAAPALALVGTYFAMLRRLVIDDSGELVLDTSRLLEFWPHAFYLIIGWLIFTIAIILTRPARFRGAKRFALASFNNAGLAGLLALAAYITGYGAFSFGWSLFDSGLIFLIVSRFAGYAETEPEELMGLYAAQGLALVTAGIMFVFTGVTRAVALLLETLLLGTAGAFAADRILTVSTYVAGFFATAFALWEMAVYGQHPWILGFGGGMIMLINAWNCRSEVRHSRQERHTIVVSTTCFCVLGVILFFAALCMRMSTAELPPALAFLALILTFAIYQFSILELPALAQLLLLAGLGLTVFPIDNGEAVPGWAPWFVAAVTLLLTTWWSRQRLLFTGPWTSALLVIYGLGLVGLAYEAVRPWCDAQWWIVAASLLSLVFLWYGVIMRAWALAVAGQALLLVALYHVFLSPARAEYPWAWWAAALPIAVAFSTARATREWLRMYHLRDPYRTRLLYVTRAYQALALLGLTRWVFAMTSPEQNVVAMLLFLGTILLAISLKRQSSFGVRCSFVLSGFAMLAYFSLVETTPVATFLTALAMFFFLMQPCLLRPNGRGLVSPLEYWCLMVCAVGTCWLFCSAWAWTQLGPECLTMAWALFALVLFVLGLATGERRFRSFGVGVLIAAIIRVFCADFPEVSNGFRVVLTFFLLAGAALVIGLAMLNRDRSV